MTTKQIIQSIQVIFEFRNIQNIHQKLKKNETYILAMERTEIKNESINHKKKIKNHIYHLYWE